MPRITLRFNDDDFNKLKIFAQAEPFNNSVGKFAKHKLLDEKNITNRIIFLKATEYLESIISDLETITNDDPELLKLNIIRLKEKTTGNFERFNKEFL